MERGGGERREGRRITQVERSSDARTVDVPCGRVDVGVAFADVGVSFAVCS